MTLKSQDYKTISTQWIKNAESKNKETFDNINFKRLIGGSLEQIGLKEQGWKNLWFEKSFYFCMFQNLFLGFGVKR